MIAEKTFRKALDKEKEILEEQHKKFKRHLNSPAVKEHAKKIKVLEKKITPKSHKKFLKKLKGWMKKYPYGSPEEKLTEILAKRIEEKLGDKLEDKFLKLIRKEVGEQENKYERYLAAVDGDFEKKQALMAEYLGAMEDDLESVKENVGIMKEDIDYIKIDIGFIKQDLENKVNRDELVPSAFVRK
jgi:hypothetical protein